MADGGSEQLEAAETERLRATMKAHPGAQVDFARPELFSFSTPLEIELRGQDLKTIEVAGQRMAAMLRANPHYADVKSTVEEGFPEIQIRFDQERAGALGLTTRQIADIVVKKVRGDVATRYSFRDRKIDVLVRARETDRATVESIRRLIVNPGSNRPVTLDSVADVVSTTGPSEIHRADQVRVAIVSANLRDIDLGSAVQEVNAMVAERNAVDGGLGAGIGMHIGGQGEELAESVQSLLFAFGLAIFLVYLVMASQFESLLHPFVILFTIPLALVGAVLALLLTNSPVSVVVFIGLILLVGLVVKNAIILIDKVNQLREAGVAKREALDRRRAFAPAADHHDHAVHAVRLPAAGDRDGRGRRSALADGDHRDRRPAGVHAADAAGDPGGVRPAGPACGRLLRQARQARERRHIRQGERVGRRGGRAGMNSATRAKRPLASLRLNRGLGQ